ncbi:MAG: sulfotransferase family 2 domain-containing protein [Shewanella sp.]|nr:sulfotransferase family 2 domain-containing protein [Shewanella sp.]
MNVSKLKLLKRIPKQLNQALGYAFGDDKYIGRVETPFSHIVKGWAGCKQTTNPVWVKISKGEEVQVVLANEPRPDVLQGKQLSDANCGFCAVFSDNNLAKAIVEVMLAGPTLSIAKPNYQGRKLFFIHIPKTAGSSVNSNIQAQLQDNPGFTHAEGMKNDWQNMGNAPFISGHIRYTDYQRHFAKGEFITLAFFREPFSHLKSHLNWVRHLSEPEKVEFFNNHSEVVKQISRNLFAKDFYAPSTWAAFADEMKPREYGLFDNPQVRYLADIAPNQKVTTAHLTQALNRLDSLHLVGLAEEFDSSMQLVFSAMGFGQPVNEFKSENINRFDYGADFSSTEIREHLNPLVQYDQQLYTAAKQKFSQQQIIFG